MIYMLAGLAGGILTGMAVKFFLPPKKKEENLTAAEEKKARMLKKKLGVRFVPSGSAVEFISLYDRIEQRCNAMLPENVLQQIQENKGKHFEYTIELLRKYNPLVKLLIADLKRIHRCCVRYISIVLMNSHVTVSISCPKSTATVSDTVFAKGLPD